MSSAEEFDEFYVKTRRRLLLQTFALTGDLVASRSAVRDAYVAARHHWSRVGRMADPERWVRPRAWSTAQRRHTARPWHRERQLTDENKAVLDALDRLPDADRKTLLLTHLAAAPLSEIGREIGVTQHRVEQLLQSATAAIAVRLDIDSTGIRGALDRLEPVVSETKLPRAPIIRRSGVRRRRSHAVAGSLVLALLTIGSGAFVAQGSQPPRAAAQEGPLVSRAMLLDVASASSIAPRQRWRQLSTSDNTRGTGINSLCQSSRFADEDGLGTWVRKFSGSGRPGHLLTETVEISQSPGSAKEAYATTLGWFAGCSVAHLQLLDSWRISGVGNQAQLLHLRIPDRRPRSYLVAVSRTGALTVSTLLETRDGPAPRVQAVARALASAVRGVCASRAADLCVTRPRVQPVLPPPSGQAKGMLAVADLPVVGKLERPWVGTDPTAAQGTLAATTCDRTDFGRAGARDPITRSFLVPQAHLPKRFGLTETIGSFATVKGARRFVATVTRQMRACPKRELASTVSHELVVSRAHGGSQFALWRLENQINKSERKVSFWMGVIRVGNYVGQVSFTPVKGHDLDEQVFRAVVARARDRLFELAPAGRR